MPVPAHGRRSLLRSRWAAVRARGADQRGVIFVMTAGLMVVFIGLAALAIDLGSFYQAQRQAQAAADAGALAGADALASGASAAAASATATSLASSNYPSATPPAAAINGTSVTVSVANTSPAYFGRIFGVTKENVGARAVASGKQTTTPCAAPGNNCYAVFAMDPSCSNSGVTFQGGGTTITGGVHSNGSISQQGGGNQWGPTTYGPSANGCSMNIQGGGNSWTSGPTSGPVVNTWPIDYSVQYPACSGSACTGPHATPSFCTYASASYSFSSSPAAGTYCAYGTGSPSDPATYTGAVSFSGGGFSVTGSFVCGNVSISGGGLSFTPYNFPGNQLLFYAAGSGTAADLGGGGTSFSGHTFAPNGTIHLNSGGNQTTFLEGKDIDIHGGGMTITGSGPSVPGSGGSSSGTASLTQ